ncbi:MAG: DUF2256 domain-containing protein [Hyphomonadaceae bacterium JAD_PAG50586_4]|nr:MAG: DUF2256 domain-containing protein [Hyphomonadaceae bacterium JAD_PAG50586_4]
MKTVNAKRTDKAQLAQKTCAACARPFSWRKKWARDWTHVRYCSRRCSGNGPKAEGTANQVDARNHKARAT